MDKDYELVPRTGFAITNFRTANVIDAIATRHSSPLDRDRDRDRVLLTSVRHIYRRSFRMPKKGPWRLETIVKWSALAT